MAPPSSEAGQALREDAPEIRKEIDGEIQVDQFTPQPVFPHPRVHAGVPPSVSYSPNTGPPVRGMDPPEAEGVSGYRQPPLPYYDNHSAGHSGRGPHPNYHPHYSGRGGYHPQQYPTQPHMHQQYPQSQHPQGPHYGMYPPQRQPQFTGGPRNRFGAPLQVSDRRGDFPSLAMSVGTDYTMSDVSEFTPVSANPRHVVAAPQATRPSVPVRDTSLDQLKENTKTFEGTTVRQSSSDKSSLAVSELSVSGLKASAMNVELATPKESPADNRPNMSTLTMSLGLSRNFSFPDLFLSTGDLEIEEEPLAGAENEKNNSDPSNGGSTHKKTKSGRLFRQSSAHRHSSSESSSIYTADSLKLAKGFHPVRGRNNTDVSGLQDAMSLMSMDHQSFKSEASWLEAAKNMQSISSDMNPWASGEGNSLRMAGADDGSIRSLLSDMSNDLNALDLAELPLLPPFHQSNSGLDDSGGFMQRPDP